MAEGRTENVQEIKKEDLFHTHGAHEMSLQRALRLWAAWEIAQEENGLWRYTNMQHVQIAS